MSPNRPVRLQVQRVVDLTPHMRRIVFGGPSFGDYLERDIEFTDKYVKLVFLADNVDYPEPLDLDEVRATLPQTVWPVLRTYTVRSVDPDAHELEIDFVLHGAEGLAGPWAATARPGDTLHMRGPGGAYAPDPEADWHLLVGDEAALPAISAALEALDPQIPAIVFVEVDGPDDELPLARGPLTQITWLHRAPAEPGTTSLLDDAVQALEFPPGRAQAFVHGEAGLLSTVRRHLLNERGVVRADLSASAYWRRGDTEEAFRQWKAEQKAAGISP